MAALLVLWMAFMNLRVWLTMVNWTIGKQNHWDDMPLLLVVNAHVHQVYGMLQKHKNEKISGTKIDQIKHTQSTAPNSI